MILQLVCFAASNYLTTLQRAQEGSRETTKLASGETLHTLSTEAGFRVFSQQGAPSLAVQDGFQLVELDESEQIPTANFKDPTLVKEFCAPGVTTFTTLPPFEMGSFMQTVAHKILPDHCKLLPQLFSNGATRLSKTAADQRGQLPFGAAVCKSAFRQTILVLVGLTGWSGRRNDAKGTQGDNHVDPFFLAMKLKSLWSPDSDLLRAPAPGPSWVVNAWHSFSERKFLDIVAADPSWEAQKPPPANKELYRVRLPRKRGKTAAGKTKDYLVDVEAAKNANSFVTSPGKMRPGQFVVFVSNSYTALAGRDDTTGGVVHRGRAVAEDAAQASFGSMETRFLLREFDTAHAALTYAETLTLHDAEPSETLRLWNATLREATR